MELYRKVRRAFPLAMYEPYEEQSAFHASEAGIAVASGGNQAGKTTALLAECMSASFGFRIWLPPEHPAFIVRRVDGSGKPLTVPNVGQFACVDYQNAWRNSILPKFEELAPPGYYTLHKNAQGIVNEIEWVWGSKWLIKSYDQEWLKYESGTIDWAGFDEPPPRKIFISTMRGLMKSAGPIELGMTPHSEEWLKEQLYSRDDRRMVEIFRLPTRSNVALSKFGVDRFESFLTGRERGIRMEGDTDLHTGKCVPGFSARAPWVVEEFDIPSEWLRVMVVDPHESKPDACLWWAVSPDGSESVVYDEVMDGRTRGSFRQTAQTIFGMESTHTGRPRRRLVDPRAAQKLVRDSGRTYREEFFAAGVSLEPAPGISQMKGFKKLDGWFAVREDTGKPFCRVLASCDQTIAQLAFTCWATDKENYENRERIKGPDDFLACLRYLVTWGPSVERLKTFGPEGAGGWIEAEKEPEVDLSAVESGSFTGYGEATVGKTDFEAYAERKLPVASWKK